MTRLAGSLTDITDAKLADPLTGLPNRLLFVDLIAREIKRTARRRDHTFALLALGLDRFNAVDHGLGRPMADGLLVADRPPAPGQPARQRRRHAINPALRSRGSAATSSRSCSRTSLTCTTPSGSRIGCGRRSASPFDVEGHQVFVSATVGITVGTTGYVKAEDVLRMPPSP